MATILDKIKQERQAKTAPSKPLQVKFLEEDELEQENPEIEEKIPEKKSSIFQKIKEEKEKQKRSLPTREAEEHIDEETEEKPIEEKPKEPEDPFLKAARNINRASAKVSETIFGTPGDIESFARFLLGADQQTLLPTSQELHEKVEKYGGEQFAPQSEYEEKADELVGDITSFATGGAKNIGKVIGIPIAGFFAREGLEKAGHEDKAGYGKMGTMFLLDVISGNKGGVKKYLSNLFNKSESLISPGTVTSATKLEKNLRNLEKNLLKGGSSPSVNQSVTKINEILDKVKNGQIPVDELTATRRKINELIEEGGGFDVTAPKKLQQRNNRNLGKVKNEVIDAIEDYSKVNPEFGKLNRAANEGYQTYAASNYFTNFMEKNFGKTIKSPILKSILGLAGTAGTATSAIHFPTTTAATLGAIPVYQGIKYAHRIAASPTLRKYYSGIISNAMKGNVQATARYVDALDKALIKEEKEKEMKINKMKKQLHLKKKHPNRK